MSALTVGTSAYVAISSIRDWSKVRHTIAAACGPITRATSATDSRLPIWARLPSTTMGKPPSSAMPVVKETWVRSVGLSKMTATVRGPANGRSANRSALSLRGERQHLGLLDRGEVVVAKEVPGHEAAP